ncbi:MAG: hypothetical protein NTZ72_19065 [Afipia sp.]|nr:hypothetical protein [Afipia sp.]
MKSHLATELELIKARLEALGGGQGNSTDFDTNGLKDAGDQGGSSEEGGP